MYIQVKILIHILIGWLLQFVLVWKAQRWDGEMCHALVHVPNGTGPGWIQELGARSGSSVWVVGTPALEPYPCLPQCRISTQTQTPSQGRQASRALSWLWFPSPAYLLPELFRMRVMFVLLWFCFWDSGIFVKALSTNSIDWTIWNLEPGLWNSGLSFQMDPQHPMWVLAPLFWFSFLLVHLGRQQMTACIPGPCSLCRGPRWGFWLLSLGCLLAALWEMNGKSLCVSLFFCQSFSNRICSKRMRFGNLSNF